MPSSEAMSSTTDIGSNCPSASPSRSVWVINWSDSPMRLATTTCRGPQPWASSSLPSASGGFAGAVSTATFGDWMARSAASASGRPWAETTSASSHVRPAAAQASDTDDGAGRTWRPSGVNRSASKRVMPKKPGSPEERTQTRCPAARWPAIRSISGGRGPTSSIRSATGDRNGSSANHAR